MGSRLGAKAGIVSRENKRTVPTGLRAHFHRFRLDAKLALRIMKNLVAEKQ